MACIYCGNTFCFGCVNGITTCGACNTVQPKKEDVPTKCETCNKEGLVKLKKFPKSERFFVCEYPSTDCILVDKWLCLDCGKTEDKKWKKVEEKLINFYKNKSNQF